jgi:hypothetical protein
MWRAGFGRGFGPVVRRTAIFMKQYIDHIRRYLSLGVMATSEKQFEVRLMKFGRTMDLTCAYKKHIKHLFVVLQLAYQHGGDVEL